MSYTRDILFAKKDGKGGTIWVKVGMLINKENGKTSIKLDSIPVGFDGWLMVSDGTKKEEKKPIIEGRKYTAHEIADSDIPF